MCLRKISIITLFFSARWDGEWWVDEEKEVTENERKEECVRAAAEL